MNIEKTIETALLAGLQRHSKSQFGTVASIEPAGYLTRITGYFHLGSVAADVATVVKAQLAAELAADVRS